MDMIPDHKMPFYIDSWLPCVPEPLSKISERFAAVVAALNAIDPLLTDFYYPTRHAERLPLPSEPHLLEKPIYDMSCLGGASNPNPDFGFCFMAATIPDSDEPEPDRMTLMMKAGGRDSNRVWLHTDQTAPDQDLVAYATVKAILFALADSFDPLFAHAYPAALDEAIMRPEGKKARPFVAGWMVLLPPGLARQVVPPPSIIAEMRADGSLFMAATDDTFDVTNPAHMAVSKAMQDAIAPINDWSLFKPSST